MHISISYTPECLTSPIPHPVSFKTTLIQITIPHRIVLPWTQPMRLLPLQVSTDRLLYSMYRQGRRTCGRPPKNPKVLTVLTIITRGRTRFSKTWAIPGSMRMGVGRGGRGAAAPTWLNRGESSDLICTSPSVGRFATDHSQTKTASRSLFVHLIRLTSD